MKTMMRSSILRLVPLLLVLAATGCTAYHPGVLPPGEPEAPAPRVAHDGEIPTTSLAPSEAPRVVAAGSQVRIVMKDGSTVSGEVLRVATDRVVMGKATNYGLEETEIVAADMESLEIRRPTGFGNVASTTGLVITAMIIVLMVAAGSVQWPAS